MQAFVIIAIVECLLIMAVGVTAILLVVRYRKIAAGWKNQAEVFQELLKQQEEEKQAKLIKPKKAQKKGAAE
jgi:signal transduction histidine kinase